MMEVDDSMVGNQTFTFLILGDAGSGKSTFVNYLVNFFLGETDFDKIKDSPSNFKCAIPAKHWADNVLRSMLGKFPENNIEDNTVSQTSGCNIYSLTSAMYPNKTLKVIDTPGFNSTPNENITDDFILQQVKQICFQLSSINGIILVINGSSQRLNETTRSFIEYLMRFLPNKLSQRVIFLMTNSSELNCNFNPDSIKESITSDHHFYMQSSLLKWDKMDTSESRMRRMKSDWNDAIESLTEIVTTLFSMKVVSTNWLSQTEVMSSQLSESIKEEIEKFLNLYNKRCQICMQKSVIENSITTMMQNMKHEKDYVIEAIPFSSAPERNQSKHDVKSMSNTQSVIQDKGRSDSSFMAPNNSKQENLSGLYLPTQRNIHASNERFSSVSNITSNNSSVPFTINYVTSLQTPTPDVLQNATQEIESPNHRFSAQNPTLFSSDENSRGVINQSISNINVKRQQQEHGKYNLQNDPNSHRNQKSAKPVKPAVVKLQVSLPDNLAINHYHHAQSEFDQAELNLKNLNTELITLENDLSSSFQFIEHQILELKTVCKGFNFVKEFYETMQNFESKAKALNSKTLLHYYETLAQVIQKC